MSVKPTFCKIKPVTLERRESLLGQKVLFCNIEEEVPEVQILMKKNDRFEDDKRLNENPLLAANTLQKVKSVNFAPKK